MKKLLGLDISSSTVGWSVFSYSDDDAILIDYGHIKPVNKKKSTEGIPYRLDSMSIEFDKILEKHNLDTVVVEDYAKKFQKGKSRASVIIILAVFNEVCCYKSYKHTGHDPDRIAVTTIRSQVSKYFGKKIVSKDEVFPVIVENSKIYKTVNNRVGNIKVECGDEVDAIAACIAYLRIQNPDVKIEI